MCEEGNKAKLKREFFFSTQLMKSLPFPLSDGVAWKNQFSNIDNCNFVMSVEWNLLHLKTSVVKLRFQTVGIQALSGTFHSISCVAVIASACTGL